MDDDQQAIRDSLKAVLDRVEAGFGRMDAGFDRAEARMSRMEEAVGRLRIDLMSRMDRLQDTLTAVAEDLNVGLAAIDHGGARHHQTQNDLHLVEMRAGMVHRRLMTLEQRILRIEEDRAKDQGA